MYLPYEIKELIYEYLYDIIRGNIVIHINHLKKIQSTDYESFTISELSKCFKVEYNVLHKSIGISHYNFENIFDRIDYSPLFKFNRYKMQKILELRPDIYKVSLFINRHGHNKHRTTKFKLRKRKKKIMS